MKCQRFFILSYPRSITFSARFYLFDKVRYYLVESCFGLHNLHTTANIQPETLFVSSSGSVKQNFANDLMNPKVFSDIMWYQTRNFTQGIFLDVKYLLALSIFDQTTTTRKFSLKCQIVKGFEEDLFNSWIIWLLYFFTLFT